MSTPKRQKTKPLDDPSALGLWTERDAAAFLAMSPRALQMWRQRGKGPRYLKVAGYTVRYRPEDVRRFILDEVRSSTRCRVSA